MKARLLWKPFTESGPVVPAAAAASPRRPGAILSAGWSTERRSRRRLCLGLRLGPLVVVCAPPGFSAAPLFLSLRAVHANVRRDGDGLGSGREGGRKKKKASFCRIRGSCWASVCCFDVHLHLAVFMLLIHEHTHAHPCAHSTRLSLTHTHI